MKRLLLSLLFLPAICLGGGPKYAYDDPKLDDEISNIYHDHSFPNIVYGRASTMTVTYLQVSSITLNGTNLTVTAATTPSPLNIAINGGFEIGQRGITFSDPANATYTLDRWKMDTNEATNVTVTRDATVKDSGLYSMKVVIASAGASKTWNIYQLIENYADYRGKTVTFSTRIFSSVANTMRVQIGDDSSNVKSSYHTGGGGWETISVTFTVGAAATTLEVHIGALNSDKANGTFYFDSAMFSVGSSAITFVPIDPQIELARCQRYYEKSYLPDIAPATAGASNDTFINGSQYAATSVASCFIGFKATKRVAPTITLYRQSDGTAASWLWYSVATVGTNRVTAVTQADTYGFNVQQTAALEYFAEGHWVANSEM